MENPPAVAPDGYCDDAGVPLDAIGLAESIRAGRLTPRDAVAHTIERLQAAQPTLNAMVHERYAAALAEAEHPPEGPLCGVPFVVKDLGMQVKGMPLTRGSRLFDGAISDEDSLLVQRYKEAGMIVVGSTNTPELGRNCSTEPAMFGPTHNPWKLGYSTGGSSGGSAAVVAAGLIPVGHANDGGGSIRIPAAACGLVGLKPSRGRVSTYPNPSVMNAPMSCQHAVTRSVRDSALLLDLVTARRPGDFLGAGSTALLDAIDAPPRPVTIAYCTQRLTGEPLADDTLDLLRAAAEVLASQGHTLVEARPEFDVGQVMATFAPLMRAEMIVTINRRLAELGRDLREDDLEPFTRSMYDAPPHLATDFVVSLAEAQRIAWRIGDFFSRYPVWLTPTLAKGVPELGYLDTSDLTTIGARSALYSEYTSVFNLTGQTAISLPAGLDQRGLPFGIQLAADVGAEELLLRLARQYERANPWPTVAPGWAS